MTDTEPAEVSIEQLEETVELYEIESDHKLEELRKLFEARGELDLSTVFYEDKNAIEMRFQSVLSDLVEFLVNQEVATTDKLRSNFDRILNCPLNQLFRISRFQLFDLKLNGFDIELTPSQAIQQLCVAIAKNVEQFLQYRQHLRIQNKGLIFANYQQFYAESRVVLLRDQIFTWYSYVRKGAAMLNDKHQSKSFIVEQFNRMAKDFLPVLIACKDIKTIKELSILNYEIYELDNAFEAMAFYFALDFHPAYLECFETLVRIATKCSQTCNYAPFINFIMKHSARIEQAISQIQPSSQMQSLVEGGIVGILSWWSAGICYFTEVYSIFKHLSLLHPDRIRLLKLCLAYKSELTEQQIALTRSNFRVGIERKGSDLMSLMHPLSPHELFDSLKQFYQSRIYTLRIKDYGKDTIDELLLLSNGTKEVSQFLEVVQKAFYLWNFSVDFAQPKKYLPSQFKKPEAKELAMSLTIVSNYCTFLKAPFGQIAVEALNIHPSECLLGLVVFILKQQVAAGTKYDAITEQFLTSALDLMILKNSFITHSADLLGLLSKKLQYFSSGDLNVIYRQLLFQRRQQLTIQEFVSYAAELHSVISDQSELCTSILHLLFGATQIPNRKVKSLRLIGLTTSALETLTSDQVQFITSKCEVVDGKITLKSNTTISLSELSFAPNPLKFDRTIDNLYFNLPLNARRTIQELARLVNSKQYSRLVVDLLLQILKQYPIATAYLSLFVVQTDQGNKRFLEAICESIDSDDIVKIVNGILTQTSIRYCNGSDYVSIQLCPIAMRIIIAQINKAQTVNFRLCSVLTTILTRLDSNEVKSQIVSNSIQVIKHAMASITNADAIASLSLDIAKLWRKFFSLKQQELRKDGLSAGLQRNYFKQIRKYSRQAQKQDIKAAKVNLTCSIIPSSYALQEQVKEKETLEGNQLTTDVSTPSVSAKEIISQLSHQQEQSQQLSSVEVSTSDSTFNLQDNLIESCLGLQAIIQIETLQRVCLSYPNRSHPSAAQLASLATLTQTETDSLVGYYMRSLMISPLNDDAISGLTYWLLSGSKNADIAVLLGNPHNLEKIFANLNLLLGQIHASLQPAKRKYANVSAELNSQWLSQTKQQKILCLLNAFKVIGFSSILCQCATNLPAASKVFSCFQPHPLPGASILTQILKFSLNDPTKGIQSELSQFLQVLFETRPKEETSLTYNLEIDQQLLNLIMKSLSIPHVDSLSHVLHSNFGNLRMYTDQLHEGLRQLTPNNHNRSYKEFIQLSPIFQDEEFYNLMKLFKENFVFFIKVEKEGYQLKKCEELRLTIDRLRNAASNQTIAQQYHRLLAEYKSQLRKIKSAMANRVKSFYLVSKLRDLSYQNAQLITLMYQFGLARNIDVQPLIDKLDVVSLVNDLFCKLVLVQKDFKSAKRFQSYNVTLRNELFDHATFCTSKRFSHSIDGVFLECQLELDEVLQRSLDEMKFYLTSPNGVQWLQRHQVYPAFLIRSFIRQTEANELVKFIKDNLKTNQAQVPIVCKQASLCEDILKELTKRNKQQLYSTKGLPVIHVDGKPVTLEAATKAVFLQLQESSGFTQTKSGQYYLLNKYANSETVLACLELLGMLIGLCLFHKIKIGIPLHPSIVSALCFNVLRMEDLLDVDFNAWEHIKKVLAVQDIKSMNLCFTYSTANLQGQPQVHQLTAKGASKTVTNSNREEYCDLLCQHQLFNLVKNQLIRLMVGILSVLPKEFMSCLGLDQVYSCFYDQNQSAKLFDQSTAAVSLTLVDNFFDGKKIQPNLKSYQLVQWILQALAEEPILRSKLWPSGNVLFVATVLSTAPKAQIIHRVLILSNFENKAALVEALKKLA